VLVRELAGLVAASRENRSGLVCGKLSLSGLSEGEVVVARSESTKCVI